LSETNNLQSYSKSEQTQDISYLGTHRSEKLDIYLPDSAPTTPTPAVIMIHGGGWTGGDKTSERALDIAATFTDEGYAVLSINYDLVVYHKDADGNIVYPIDHDAFPQNLYDCKSAIQWVRKNATTYNIDADRIALIGASAGAHLALLTGMTHGTKHDNGGLYPEYSTEVNGIISLYGPTNLKWFGSHMFSGVTKYKIEEYSPISHITADTPPLLIFHGTNDAIVKFQDSSRFAERLQKFEATNSMTLDYTFKHVENGLHSFRLSPEFKNNYTDLRPQATAFLHRIFHPRPRVK
jgi:acetyl esterase/lipase